MTIFNVHIYRELQLSYTDIEADTPEAAAEIARGLSADRAEDIGDCKGETFAALVNVFNDERHDQSVTIDFEANRMRKTAPKLLVALEELTSWIENYGPPDGCTWHDLADSITNARAAIGEATNEQPEGRPA